MPWLHASAALPSRALHPTTCLPTVCAAGAYPASLDDAETERILTTLLELGGC